MFDITVTMTEGKKELSSNTTRFHSVESANGFIDYKKKDLKEEGYSETVSTRSCLVLNKHYMAQFERGKRVVKIEASKVAQTDAPVEEGSGIQG